MKKIDSLFCILAVWVSSCGEKESKEALLTPVVQQNQIKDIFLTPEEVLEKRIIDRSIGKFKVGRRIITNPFFYLDFNYFGEFKYSSEILDLGPCSFSIPKYQKIEESSLLKTPIDGLDHFYLKFKNGAIVSIGDYVLKANREGSGRFVYTIDPDRVRENINYRRNEKIEIFFVSTSSERRVNGGLILDSLKPEKDQECLERVLEQGLRNLDLDDNDTREFLIRTRSEHLGVYDYKIPKRVLFEKYQLEEAEEYTDLIKDEEILEDDLVRSPVYEGTIKGKGVVPISEDNKTKYLYPKMELVDYVTESEKIEQINSKETSGYLVKKHTITQENKRALTNIFSMNKRAHSISFSHLEFLSTVSKVI